MFNRDHHFLSNRIPCHRRSLTADLRPQCLPTYAAGCQAQGTEPDEDSRPRVVSHPADLPPLCGAPLPPAATDGAASAEPCSHELCRVATEVDDRQGLSDVGAPPPVLSPPPVLPPVLSPPVLSPPVVPPVCEPPWFSEPPVFSLPPVEEPF